jgi:uncharacterized protein (DUF1697 family)
MTVTRNTRYVALLRAVNVGGTKLPMSELRAVCVAAGFEQVETYIASGNVVFTSHASGAQVQSQLQRRLAELAGKPITVVLRTAAQMRSVLAANPFAQREPRLTHAFFLPTPPPKDAIDGARHRQDEDIRLGEREIYVYYPHGMGQSRLQIPAAAAGTARNMNTVGKLAAMASQDGST